MGFLKWSDPPKFEHTAWGKRVTVKPGSIKKLPNESEILENKKWKRYMDRPERLEE